MANSCSYNRNQDIMTSENYNVSESNTLNSTTIDHRINQRQLSDNRVLTNYYIIFENTSIDKSHGIYFLEYLGTRARNHHQRKLYLPQIINQDEKSPDVVPEEFSTCVKQVLKTIPYQDLSSYFVSIRTGLTYFFSNRFQFNKEYSVEETRRLIQKEIPTTDLKYYYRPRNNNKYPSDDSLRSSFCNIKPISTPQEFVAKLKEYKFYVKQQKHVFRIYLQSEDNQTHVCVVDPASNYSIVEFSKDFQRMSNIDFIRDRSVSAFKSTKTFDDIFDFRVQFQYNPSTRNDQSATMEYELCQQFPSLGSNFTNANILKPLNNDFSDDQELQICKELSPYVRFIRRDFGDIYAYNGDDELFENFTIYLESTDEYNINIKQGTCRRSLDSHGVVYARLHLGTMISSSSIDENLLILKLWNMGEGLTALARQCSTSEIQLSTNYYAPDGNQYTAQDEIIVQTILKQKTLQSMLGLRYNAANHEIDQKFNSIKSRLETKWNSIQCGRQAYEKLNDAYKKYFEGYY